jgi:hypothetical protein
MTSIDGTGGQPDAMERRARARARARVAELQAFYIHLVVYLAVNVGLFAIDVIGDGSLDWAFWPALGWGIGLAAHALVTFRSIPAIGAGWRERKIEELTQDELDRERER